MDTKYSGLEVAIVGMSGRFPKAQNIKEFWSNLVNGVESHQIIDNNIELALSPEEKNRIRFEREDINNFCFDASFFGYTDDEAELMNPDMRILHEEVWSALEDAGYNPHDYEGTISLFAGSRNDSLWNNMVYSTKKIKQFHGFYSETFTKRDYLCTRIAYSLNLKGNCCMVGTACSTSLVAVHLACRALLFGECNIAIAGGVATDIFKNNGYQYQDGMIFSKDGHVRPFDSEASGFIAGEGCGVVVLKRLKEALKDGDNIYAIIKGSAVNNDGNRKVGFTAPSIDGQRSVIKKAHAFGRTNPNTVSYVEAHGTATPLGDIIEFSSLKDSLGKTDVNTCAIGSVKSNIGHLEESAGIAGLIKTSLCMYNNQLVPSLNFTHPHPDLKMDKSSFYVNTDLKEWTKDNKRVRAAVSSFGIGGTNTHIVVESKPFQKAQIDSDDYNLILLSARSQTILDKMTLNLIGHLNANNTQSIEDISYTLQVGRKHFEYRRKLITKDKSDLSEKLKDEIDNNIQTNLITAQKRNLVFLFSGLGNEYYNMGKGMYEKYTLFREELDKCFKIVETECTINLNSILYPVNNNASTVNLEKYNQLLVFSVEYALARFLIGLGLIPYALLGYSFGEYAAACISGIFNLEQAIKMIAKRSELIYTLKEGSMLSVPVTVSKISDLISDKISIAIDNGDSCVLSGSKEDIDKLQETLKNKRILCNKLKARRAVHSYLMDPILEQYEDYIKQFQFSKPQIPIISNVAGNWITNLEMSNEKYWIKQLRNTVQFSSAIQTVKEVKNAIYIEIGPSYEVSNLINRDIINEGRFERAVNLLRSEAQQINDELFFLDKLGKLWLKGVDINWNKFHEHKEKKRVSLPSYPFEPTVYSSVKDNFNEPNFYSGQNRQVSFYNPVWKPNQLLGEVSNKLINSNHILLFLSDSFFDNHIINELRNKNCSVSIIKVGKEYANKNNDVFEINPQKDIDYLKCFKQLRDVNKTPNFIIHLWNVDNPESTKIHADRDFDDYQQIGFYSLLAISKAISELNIENDITIKVISTGVYNVLGNEKPCIEKSTLIGPCIVINQELNNVHCQHIDLDYNTIERKLSSENLIDVFAEIFSEIENSTIALRNNFKWTQTFAQNLTYNKKSYKRLKHNGVYLITGGLGGIGLEIAESIAEKVNARVILLSRSSFPEREKWNTWLNKQGKENTISEKILRIHRIENKGAEVFIYKADVSNEKEIKQTIDIIHNDIGLINGIIHAAVVPDGALIIRRNRQNSENVFKSKIFGTLTLNKVFKNVELDFIILCSSIDSQIGGIGQVAYTSTNIFLDHFANWYNSISENYIVSINWDRWKNIGIANGIENLHKQLTNKPMEGGINAEEGIQALHTILNSSLDSQIIVIKTELNELIMKEIKLKSLEKILISDNIEKSSQLRARPDILTNYQPASNTVQSKLVKIWTSILGVDKIGVKDNFFELGGDSMKFINMLSVVNRKLNNNIALNRVINNPTIDFISNVFLHEKLFDEGYIVFNSNRNKSIFCFPPMVSVGTGYHILAKYLDAFKIVSFSFISKEDYVSWCCDKIISMEEGPYILFGYSAGGLISLEIACELERRGKSVSKIFMFDPPPMADLSNDAYYQVMEQIKNGISNYNLDYKTEETLLNNSLGYLRFLFSTFESYNNTVNSDIYFMLEQNETYKGAGIDFSNITSGKFKLIEGKGSHSNLLSEANINLINTILTKKD